MTLHWIDLAVVAAYLLAILGIGVYQARRIRTSGDYFAGGRRFNKFYSVMNALGAGTHADEPAIVGGAAYRYGVSGIWFNYVYLLINPIFWLIAPYFRRSRFLTTADFFKSRYGGGLWALYSVMGVINLTVTMATLLKGTGAIAAGVSGMPHAELWAILAMTVVVVAYSFAGGLIATAATNTVQGALEVVMSLLLVPFGLYVVGGFAGLHASLDKSMFDLTGVKVMTGTWVLATSATALIGLVAQPGLMALLGSGRTELEGRLGYTYGTVIKRFCAMGWVLTGLIVAAMVAQGKIDGAQLAGSAKAAEQAFGIAIRELLRPGWVGLMAACILASQMSSLSGQVVNASALASHNLYRGAIRRGAGDKEVLIVGRLFGFVIATMAVLLAKHLESVSQGLTTMIQVQSLTGLLIWGGVLWRRANAPGAWAAFVVMFAVYVCLGPAGTLLKQAALSLGVDAPPAWLGAYARPADVPDLLVRYVPAGVIALVVVSLLTKPVARKRVDDFNLLIRTPVGQEQKLIDAGVPIVYAGRSEPNHWETNHPRLVHWGGFILAACVCAAILGLLQLLMRIGA
jgi:Na+/proline symporter